MYVYPKCNVILVRVLLEKGNICPFIRKKSYIVSGSSFIQINLYELNQSEYVNVMHANWFYKG